MQTWNPRARQGYKSHWLCLYLRRPIGVNTKKHIPNLNLQITFFCCSEVFILICGLIKWKLGQCVTSPTETETGKSSVCAASMMGQQGSSCSTLHIALLFCNFEGKHVSLLQSRTPTTAHSELLWWRSSPLILSALNYEIILCKLSSLTMNTKKGSLVGIFIIFVALLVSVRLCVVNAYDYTQQKCVISLSCLAVFHSGSKHNFPSAGAQILNISTCERELHLKNWCQSGLNPHSEYYTEAELTAPVHLDLKVRQDEERLDIDSVIDSSDPCSPHTIRLGCSQRHRLLIKDISQTRTNERQIMKMPFQHQQLPVDWSITVNCLMHGTEPGTRSLFMAPCLCVLLISQWDVLSHLRWFT